MEEQRRTSWGGRTPVIFCDFDGTITLSDNVVAIMQHYNPPGLEPIVKRLVSGDASLRESVGAMFALLPSRMKDDIIDYIRQTAVIRPGFEQLLAWCRQHEVEFLVTSGGIDFIIDPLLDPFGIPPGNIFYNRSSFEGDGIEIRFPHPCDDECEHDCGMCKSTIMRRYPQDSHYRILIGDSLTDFACAPLADHIFARSHLLDRCRDTGLSHTAYETFHEVVDWLNAHN